MAQYPIKYKTFDQLLAEVHTDFVAFGLENLIEPAQLIKTTKLVTRNLGLRIYQTKDQVLELHKGRVRLPDNFYILNYALLCGDYETTDIPPQGTHVEDRVVIPKYTPFPGTPTASCETTETTNCQTPNTCDPCNPNPCEDLKECSPTKQPRLCLNCHGDVVDLVQIVSSQKRHYKMMFPLKLRNNVVDIECDCPNLRWTTAANEIWIKDGFLHSNLSHGNIYINYQGMMEDDEGNLLVPDDEFLNEYYEYALKERLLENLMFMGEDVAQKLQYTQMKLKMARNQALSYVNMPDFAEMKKVWEMNRRAQYAKYYSMFSKYAPGDYRSAAYVPSNARNL